MEDSDIVALYWARSPRALEESARRYGAYCVSIAQNITGSPQDAEECVNDAWLRAWESIPPQRPVSLRAYLGKLVRNLALNRRRQNTAEKRGGGEVPAVLEELSERGIEIVPVTGRPLSGLPPEVRSLPGLRYAKLFEFFV